MKAFYKVCILRTGSLENWTTQRIKRNIIQLKYLVRIYNDMYPIQEDSIEVITHLVKMQCNAFRILVRIRYKKSPNSQELRDFFFRFELIRRASASAENENEKRLVQHQVHFLYYCTIYLTEDIGFLGLVITTCNILCEPTNSIGILVAVVLCL